MKKVIKIVIVLLCCLGVFLIYNYIKPVDDTYKLYIVFNDDSKLELSAYFFSVFEIEDILNKYFMNS